VNVLMRLADSAERSGTFPANPEISSNIPASRNNIRGHS
jgi:hypothetical protein